MPKYLYEARYQVEGTKGLLKEGGTGRRAAVEKLAESLGGKVEVYLYAFGGVDLYVICDLPDNVSAATIGLAVNAAGAVTVKTTVLLTPEDIDAAAKKTPQYRAPGT